MNEKITLGAAVVMGTLTVATHVSRWWVKPQPPALQAHLDEATLDELLGPWPEPVHGAVAAQAWADCRACRKATAGVVVDGAWWCGECFTTVPAGAP